MAADEVLLQQACHHERLFMRVYAWDQPAVSFGYFQSHDQICDLTQVRPLVRRWTAGGLVSHVADWTYALAIPVSHPWYALKARESYSQMHQWVHRSLVALGLNPSLAPAPILKGPGQCFLGAEQDDVLLDGFKVAGAAQRRSRQGLLIQGSIQLSETIIQTQRMAWQKAMRASSPSVQWSDVPFDEPTLVRIHDLAQTKYASEEFLKRR